MMRPIDFSRPPIHRPAETDTDNNNLLTRHQLRNRPLDLLPDPCRPVGGFYHESAARVDDARCVAEDELQFGTANFNAEQ